VIGGGLLEVVGLIHNSRHFLDLGCGSLKEFELGIMQYDGLEDLDCLSIEESSDRPLIRLCPSQNRAQVIAVDATNTELGLTGCGLICAVRGTVVKVDGGKYAYARHGPFIFHITLANLRPLYDELKRIYMGESRDGSVPPVEKMAERVRVILERWLQRQAVITNSDAIILWDGSLAAPPSSSSIYATSRMLSEARARGNRVLAISKKTTLTLRGRALFDLINNELAPSMLDIDSDVCRYYGGKLSFLGHVYAAKLSRGSFTFRLDIDRGLSEDEAVEGVQQLLASDAFRENYPETLRLAHILSRFSPAEVIGMQRLVRERYGLRFSSTPNIREVIFGPFEVGKASQSLGVTIP
jgi:hypothetical protein